MNRIISSVTGETLYHKKHECGLDIYIMPRKDYSAGYAIFGTKYGSVDSEFVVPGESEITKVPDGIAHYLEHKMFDQPDGSNVFDKFSELGANANAFTSFNTTAYLFSAADNMEENLSILLDYVQSPYFTEESVRKEQGIIGQEIKMYDDSGTWRVFFNLLGALYHNHPVKKDIAGTVESISHITADLLYKCYNTFYNLSNMMIFVTGDVDPSAIEKRIDDGIKNNAPFDEEIKKLYPEEPDTISKKIVEQSLSVAIPLFMIGFKDTDTGYSGDRLLKKYIEVSILNKMLFSKGTKLYRELSDNGLINDNFSFDYTLQPDYAHVTVDGESSDPKAVFEKILAYLAEKRGSGLCREEYERAKKVIWGDYIRSYNDVEEFSHSFLNMYMAGAVYTNFEKLYDEITFEAIEKRFLKLFDENRAALSVVNPL
ncbi:MAG: insulinase family protein [Clostridia bacterium]|nr:insulinase family protein [Clostridia bacterium]